MNTVRRNTLRLMDIASVFLVIGGIVIRSGVSVTIGELVMYSGAALFTICVGVLVGGESWEQGSSFVHKIVGAGCFLSLIVCAGMIVHKVIGLV